MKSDWTMTKINGVSIGNAILWVFIWFGFMLLYTFLDVGVWKRIAPLYERYLNLVSIMLCMIGYYFLLIKINHTKIHFGGNISFQSILLAIGCSILFYLLLDHFLDPIFEGLFKESEANYQEMLQSLKNAPGTSLIQICILAPIIEETLMRGYVLQGLSVNYGRGMALLISASLFANRLRILLYASAYGV